MDAEAGFSCGFQWSGGVEVCSIFAFSYGREAGGFVGLFYFWLC